MNLSIIICTYNNQELLKGCLECLEQQALNYENQYEVLVIDNNSKDHTKDVVAQFMQRGLIPNLKYIFEAQQGLVNARLNGIRNATSEWIAFIDDDVRIEPSWFESVVLFLRNYPRAGVVGGKIELQYLEPPSVAALKCEGALCKVDYGTQVLKNDPEGQRFHLVGAAIVFRRKALEDAGWLEKQFLTGRKGKSLSSGEDSEMIIRIQKAGWETWYNPALHSTHLIPPKRTTLSYLCRLYRGLGRSNALLKAIAVGKEIPMQRKLYFLGEDIGFITRRFFAWMFHDLLKHQSIGDKRIIQVFEGIGRIEGSLNILLQPIEFS